MPNASSSMQARATMHQLSKASDQAQATQLSSLVASVSSIHQPHAAVG
jgi:hypothetical protein